MLYFGLCRNIIRSETSIVALRFTHLPDLVTRENDLGGGWIWCRAIASFTATQPSVSGRTNYLGTCCSLDLEDHTTIGETPTYVSAVVLFI